MICPKHPIRKRPKACSICAGNQGATEPATAQLSPKRRRGRKVTTSGLPRLPVSQSAVSEPGVKMAHGVKCPKCGRAYCEVFYRPHAQKASYRCTCIGHPFSHPTDRTESGCGHEWTPKD